MEATDPGSPNFGRGTVNFLARHFLPLNALAAESALPTRNNFLVVNIVSHLTAQGSENRFRSHYDTGFQTAANVGRDHVGRKKHFVPQCPERALQRKRLILKDVQRCPSNLPLLQRLDKGALIHTHTARTIDEQGGRFHQSELLRTDHMPCLLGQHDMQGYDVGLTEKGIQVHALHAMLLKPRFQNIRIVGEHPHFPRSQEGCDAPSDPPEANDTEGETLVAIRPRAEIASLDRKSTRLNSSHLVISYAVFCLK